MIRTQISVDATLYARARKAARRMGVSLAELCRRSLQEVVAREPGRKPWMAFAGMYEGDKADSAGIDSAVYNRETP